ncbi:hypothetical protein ACHAXS_005636 [Conticribra weissflogii]
MSSAASNAAKSMGGSSRDRPSRSMSQSEPSLSERLLESSKPKVRFSEAATAAATMDAANANSADDLDRPARSPLDVVSDLFQKKYTIPTFLAAATGIFLLVHLTGGPSDEGLRVYQSPQVGDGPVRPMGDDGRDKNVGAGDGFGDIIFSLSPTFEPGNTPVPTREVTHHTTPKMAPIPEEDGNQPGWIVVPTSSGEYADPNGAPTTLKWNYPKGAPTPDPALLYNVDAGKPTTLKWNYPPGEPTPDPALLYDNSSPTTLKWNYPAGSPTPDPIKLTQGSPTTLKWNYPAGSPTPDPIKLTQGSPTTLKWNYPAGSPTPDPIKLTQGSPTTLKWNFPFGSPTPDPAKLGSPTTLKWNFPFGSPTPDPAKLGSPTTLKWNYPPGVPTPDPALLVEVAPDKGTPTTLKWGLPPAALPDGSPTTLKWGFPAGSPTPDPANLGTPTLKAGAPTTLKWGYPAGTPTPDPALLVDPGTTQPPTKRRVEEPITPKPITPAPQTPPPVEPGEPPVTAAPITPAPQTPAPVTPVPVTPPPALVDAELFPQPPEPATPPPVTKSPVPPPVPRPPVPEPPVPEPPVPEPPAPKPPTPVNVAPPPPPTPPVPRPVRNPPAPEVYTQPYSGPNGFNIPGLPNVTVPEVTPEQYLPMNIGCIPCAFMMTPQAQNVCPGHNECIVDEAVGTWGLSNEDDAVYEIFYTNPVKCCGTIVEIGAGDGKTGSVSYFFHHAMNWTAVLTEANPVEYAKIEGNRNAVNLAKKNGAFCLESAHLKFDTDTGKFQKQYPEEYTSEICDQEFTMPESAHQVECIRLDTHILAGINHVDVMVIRVKNDPWAVMRTMDWSVTVDIWILLVEDKDGMHHDALRASLRSHDYVPAAWDIKLWCDTPASCMQNEVWLRKNFNPLPLPMMGMGMQGGLRGSNANMVLPFRA